MKSLKAGLLSVKAEAFPGKSIDFNENDITFLNLPALKYIGVKVHLRLRRNRGTPNN